MAVTGKAGEYGDASDGCASSAEEPAGNLELFLEKVLLGCYPDVL